MLRFALQFQTKRRGTNHQRRSGKSLDKSERLDGLSKTHFIRQESA